MRIISAGGGGHKKQPTIRRMTAIQALRKRSEDIIETIPDHESDGGGDTSVPVLGGSPSSVVSVPLSPFRRESIAVSDTGTEVTLRDGKDADSSARDEELCRRSPSSSSSKHTRSFSLLDNDLSSVSVATPLSPETPSPSTLPLCGAVGCWSTPEETPVMRAACMDDSLSGAQIQEYILAFLSDSETSATSTSSGGTFQWQAMLSSMADDIDEETQQQDDDSEVSKSHRMKILRNRAIHLQARKERLDTIRRDLHPFTSPTTPPTTRNASVGNMIRSQSQPISAPAKPRRRPLEERSTQHQEAPWSSWSCTSIPHSPDALIWEDDDGENGCYDSDPEDSLRSRHHDVTTTATIVTPPPKSPAQEQQQQKPQHKRKSSSSIMSDHVLFAGNNIYDIVHGAFNERWTFILHPDASGQSKSNPCAVQAWMERGQRLHNTVIPPKLVYQVIGKASSSSSSTQQQQLKPRVLGTPLSSVDLLEIQRVLETDKVNRELYPFAKAQNTFTITTLSETVCLEASSKSERDRIVRLLKLLVARFGSQLVTGDYRVEEFFTMLIGNGPGGAQMEYRRY